MVTQGKGGGACDGAHLVVGCLARHVLGSDPAVLLRDAPVLHTDRGPAVKPQGETGNIARHVPGKKNGAGVGVCEKKEGREGGAGGGGGRIG